MQFHPGENFSCWQEKLNSLWCRVLDVHIAHCLNGVFLQRCLGLLQFGLCSYRSGVLHIEQHRDKPRLPEGKLEPTQSIFRAQSDPSLSPIPALPRGWVSPGQTSGAASQILMWHNGIDFTGICCWIIELHVPPFTIPRLKLLQAGLKWLWVKGAGSGWGCWRSLQPPVNVQCPICWHLRQQRRFLSEFSH